MQKTIMAYKQEISASIVIPTSVFNIVDQNKIRGITFGTLFLYACAFLRIYLLICVYNFLILLGTFTRINNLILYMTVCNCYTCPCV